MCISILLVGFTFSFWLKAILLNLDWYKTCSGLGCHCVFVCLSCHFVWPNSVILFPSSVRAIVALNLHSYGSGRNPWGNLKPDYLEKVSHRCTLDNICRLCAFSGMHFLIFIRHNNAQRCICHTYGCLPIFIFGLLPERLCCGPCWWWSTRNIWSKARVACIVCYGWTHLCQTHCPGAVSNLKFLLFMLLCKVLTTQMLTYS